MLIFGLLMASLVPSISTTPKMNNDLLPMIKMSRIKFIVYALYLP